MSKISYPAVFHKDTNGYWVEFPNLPGCFTDGESVEQAYSMAKEALGLHLDTSNLLFEVDFEHPSPIDQVISKFPNEIVMLVEYDSIEYSKTFKNKAVKKTLSIPEWLNDLAIQQDINFSQVLQEALKTKLNL